MKYTKIGLVNTQQMFRDALAGGYAVPAFNFYDMETLHAIMDAARHTHSPVILAVSESAMAYMGDNILMGLIAGQRITNDMSVALHLDHGHSIDACRHAIDIGFSSVMIDASALPFDENVKLSRAVVKYAHRHHVSVEAELGTLAGIEDENTRGTESSYTNPDNVVRFVNQTGIDSLAIAIGTSHGAYKRKHPDEKLRFDILARVAKLLPGFPLVLHGASSIPEKYVDIINRNGGKMCGARGIDTKQLSRAAKTNICKINVDSDLRIGFTAGVRETLKANPAIFNPRDYLSVATKNMIDICIDEITHIMHSKNKI